MALIRSPDTSGSSLPGVSPDSYILEVKLTFEQILLMLIGLKCCDEKGGHVRFQAWRRLKNIKEPTLLW